MKRTTYSISTQQYRSREELPQLQFLKNNKVQQLTSYLKIEKIIGSHKIRNNERYNFSRLLFSIILEVITISIRQKDKSYILERNKLSLFTDDLVVT